MEDRFPEELRPALDAWAPPAARSAFREDLRARFVSGASEAREDESVDVMTAALEAYDPRARDEFRERARTAFLDAAIDAGAPSVGQRHEAEPPLEVVPRAPRVARATRTRFRLLAGGAVASLAAAAALVIWLLQPGSVWRVEANGFSAAGIEVDGVALATGAGPTELGELLQGAREILSGTEALRLVLGDEVVVIELGPETRLDLSGIPSDTSADLALAGGEGAYRVATGDGFGHGRQRLSFRALDVDVEVTGTVFGVDVYGKDVCVCCCQGSVRVRAGDESILEAGQTRYVHAGGRSDYAQDLESHQAPLRALQAYVKALP